MVDYKKLKAKSKFLQPVMQIGKNGLSDSVIAEIKKVLKKKKLIKIKLTRGALEELDKKDLTSMIVEKTDSYLIDCVGFTITIHKK
ncbi:hypothetical protein GOV05_03760 [Candidatus Woesearchaeota archaeon]|nr:hypothetical protein [Candidatus Woesearchaeota archaeon]